MKKSLLIIITLAITLILGIILFNNFSGKAIADENTFHNGTAVNITLFYGKGCPHCAKLETYLEQLAKKYPLNIESYEIYFNTANVKLLEEKLKPFNKEIEGVPTLFIGDKVFVGYNDAIAKQIETEAQTCYNQCNPNQANSTSITAESSPIESPEKTEFKKKITIPAVISGALLDSINPCEFAVLILLLTTILSTGNKKKALLAGLAFSLSIFISYFLMGLGLYSAVATANITKIFYLIVSVLAIILGLFNLKDYFWYGKFFIMEVPLTWRPRMKLILKGITSIWGAFLVGFVISLFLLPCTSGPYIVVLGLLAETATRSYAIWLLLLYNIIFILPMLAITIIVSMELASTEKIEMWRQKNLKVFHLIAGLILIALGIFMILSNYLGWF